MKIKSQKDFFAGLMFMGVGAAFAWGATTYNVGTGARMGPGYFPLLLGILRRGVPLAEMLQERLKRQHGLDLPCYGLRLKRYADDLTLLHPETELTENAEFSARELSRATVLVVDDVLYEGHSLARVLAYLSRRGAPVVRIAVLADRCVAKLPIRASIVGVKLQVAAGDVVECHVPPYEAAFRIELLRPSLA